MVAVGLEAARLGRADNYHSHYQGSKMNPDPNVKWYGYFLVDPNLESYADGPLKREI
jgi:hypothetical protein